MTQRKRAHVRRNHKTGEFVIVNGSYVKTQASEAVKTFFAPLSGAWESAKSAGEVKRHKEKVGADKH